MILFKVGSIVVTIICNFSKAKRAMQQVVDLATQEKGNLTQDMVKTYNSQIEKFDRALKTQELMNLN